MLRINLLPAYIAERQKVRNAIIGSVAFFLIVVGGMLGYQFGMAQPELDKRTAEADAKQTEADNEQKFEQETTTIRTQIKPLQDKVDFVNNVRFYNTLRPRIFRNAAAYTYREVEYNSMSVNGNTLAISGYVKSLADMGRFYITFYGNPDVTAVSVGDLPGWTNDGSAGQGLPGQRPATQRGFPIGLTATLAKPVGRPSLPASLLEAAGGGAGAAPGAPATAAPITSDGPPPDSGR